MKVWIRVDYGVADDPKVACFAYDLGLENVHATGHLVALWYSLAMHHAGGRLADVPDALMEDWAKWRGCPGLFAETVRRYFQGADGNLTGWHERQGKLVERQAIDRQRKAVMRSQAPRQGLAEGNVRGMSADSPSPKTVTERNVTTTTRQTAPVNLAKTPKLKAWVAEDQARLALLQELADAVGPSAAGHLAIIEWGLGEGFGRGPITAHELMNALLDLKSAGWPKSGRAVRKFLEGTNGPPAMRGQKPRKSAGDANDSAPTGRLTAAVVQANKPHPADLTDPLGIDF